MSRLKILLKLVALIGVVSLLPIVLGAGVLGSEGARLGLILSLVTLLIVGITSEKIIAQSYGAHSEIPEGLRRTLDLVLETARGPISPKILVYADSFPNALIVRQVGGHGLILMSQGMIALLNDAELREVLNICLSRLENSTLIFQSLSSVFALGVLSLVPLSWSRLIFHRQTVKGDIDRTDLGPWSTLVFLILYPIVKFFLYLAASSPEGQLQSFNERSSSIAMRKMGGLIPLFVNKKNYGTAALYVIS